ncbi:MAG: tetraacyldisaccharide 4'-kinase [Alphaproteobacteria bacterium GM202ARS2]|nr:tetraacyldisaccharide 4'-kinase [Alphaproteobacteria bacterium GM202ARS2]
MMLSPPRFWHTPHSPLATLLAPLGIAIGALGRLRQAVIRPYRAAIPVLCVGNVTVGGSGKTPVVMALVSLLKKKGIHPIILTRGYGGTTKAPCLVDPSHKASQVGDEPLVLAKHAPVWVSRNRANAARLALTTQNTPQHVHCFIMDDGLQHPYLHRDLSFLVIDSHAPFGNGRIMPAGPLRESLTFALRKADAIVVLGTQTLSLASTKPTFYATRHLHSDALDAERPSIALAAIGNPKQFFHMLKPVTRLIKTYAYPDHAILARKRIAEHILEAKKHNAQLVTSEKDYVRLDEDQRHFFTPLPLSLRWRDEEQLADFLSAHLPPL